MSQVKTSPTNFIVALQSVLYKPCRCFEEILLGLLCAVGYTSWIQGADNDKRYKNVYRFIPRIGDRIQLFLIYWTLACRSLSPLESPITSVVDDAQSSVMFEKLKARDTCMIPHILTVETPRLLWSFARFGWYDCQASSTRRHLFSRRLEVLRQREQVRYDKREDSP